MRLFPGDPDLRDDALTSANRPASLRGYDHKAVSSATAVDTGDSLLVQQHSKEDVDINNIIRRFGITRQMPMGSAAGFYGDFTGIFDYDSAVDQLEKAHVAFMKLPSEVRARFDNDPGKIIALAQSLSADEFYAKFDVAVGQSGVTDVK